MNNTNPTTDFINANQNAINTNPGSKGCAVDSFARQEGMLTKDQATDSKMGAQDNVIKVCFAASCPYRPEDSKSLENDVAEPSNRCKM